MTPIPDVSHLGGGRLQALLDDPTVMSITVTGSDTATVWRIGTEDLEDVGPIVDNDEDLADIIDTLTGDADRGVRFADQTRIEAAQPPNARPELSIQRPLTDAADPHADLFGFAVTDAINEAGAPRRRDERGTASLDLAIVAPLFIIFVLMVVGLARMALASAVVDQAAAEAARAASLHRSGGAEAAGTQAANASLASRGWSCANLKVQVNTSQYQPGGAVSAVVQCEAKLTDVAMAGFPGSKVYTGRAVAPIEQYRSAD